MSLTARSTFDSGTLSNAVFKLLCQYDTTCYMTAHLAGRPV